MVVSRHSDYVPYFPISLDRKSWKVALHVPLLRNKRWESACLDGKSWKVALQVLCRDGKVLVFVSQQLRNKRWESACLCSAIVVALQRQQR
ncbi:MAG: hypothetical protein AB2556_21325, partial [Candidatus Thiodiazotropha sp.]